MSMLPVNAAHTDTILALSRYALENPSPRLPGSQVSHGNWDRWLNRSPSLHRGIPWDPPEGLHTAPVSTAAGTFTMLTGGEAESVFFLQHVLDALFLTDWPPSAASFHGVALSLVHAVLRLSHDLMQRAEMPRHVPVGAGAADVVVPGEDEFRRLQDLFDLDAAGLRAITGRPGAILDPVVHDLATGPLPATAPPAWAMESTPIVRHADRYVIADPGSLATALRHAIIVMAIDAGHGASLAERLRAASWSRARQGAENMRWRFVTDIAPTAATPVSSMVFAADGDVACHVCLVDDDLSTYKSDDPRGGWDTLAGVTSVLANRSDQVEELLLLGGAKRPPNELLHVTVLSGIGRVGVLERPSTSPPLGAPQILLSLEAFDVIGMSGADSLSLLKFAQAGSALRNHAAVQSVNVLDEYAAWKAFDDSFYMGDGARPHLITLMSDFGRTFREEVAEKTDRHAARTAWGTVVEVVRLHETPEIPIYGVLHDLGGFPRLLVELEGCAVWVVGEEGAAEPGHRAAAAQIVDAIAFWMWQLAPSLPGLDSLPENQLCINVIIDNPEAWAIGTPSAAPEPVATTAVKAADTIDVHVRSSLIDELKGPDNRGERHLMLIVLEALDDATRGNGGAALGDSGRLAVIDSHAPLGPKKKVSVFDFAAQPLLLPGQLPPIRHVQRADTALVLDELGQALPSRAGIGLGPVPKADRNRVLNEAVAFHYEQLQQLVRAMSPAGLLETLLSFHEALVRQAELDRRTLGARMACYGETGLLTDMRKEVPEAAQTAVALRFLIEYVAAQPPTGIRPLSQRVFDRLLAIASQIVNRGMSSDVVRYELEDAGVEMLASGRLGQERNGAYQAGQQSFLDAAVPAQARSAADSYPAAWQTAASEPALAAVAGIDAAAKTEWGFTLTDLAETFTALTQIAHLRGEDVVAYRLDQLIFEIDQILGWGEMRVRRAVDLLALRPRADFLMPPLPFKPPDVYPWLFNRRYSYLRRPLIVRESERGEEAVWGLRHPQAAGRYLVGLILSERLEADSSEMKQLMSRLRQKEAAAFNDLVASIYRTAGLVARERVKKIGGLRISRTNGEDLGDIDVLALDPTTKTIHATEAKYLEGARTPSELASEIEHTFAVGGTRKSATDKHLERVAWVKSHVREVLEDFGVKGDPSQWSVLGRIAVDVHVLSPYVVSSPFEVVAASELADRLRRSASGRH